MPDFAAKNASQITHGAAGFSHLLPRASLARRQGRLLARIHRRFQTVTESITLGPMRLVFTRVADPDAVLDQVVAEEDRLDKLSGRRREGDELHLPYWAELWDSAVGMGQFLVEEAWRREDDRVTRRQDEKVKRDSAQRVSLSSCHPISVLDLGCGMGLAGTVAAALGHRVMLADLEPAALLFAQLNTLPYGTRARTRQLNWQPDRLKERFDLILGADVLYDRSQWDYLEPFWRAHLERDGVVLLGEPGRQTGDAFVDWIKCRAWQLERIDVPATPRSKPIRLFLIRVAGA